MDDKNINFEEDLKRLNEIVDNISNQKVPLNEAITLYEEGNALIKKLETLLKEAEEKIEKVIEK